VTDIGGERNIHCIKRLLNVAYGLQASRGDRAIVGDDHCLTIQGASRIIPRGALLRYREWYGPRVPMWGSR